MNRMILVYVDLRGQPFLVGRLWARTGGRRQSATFEYDRAWLSSSFRFSLEPALTLGPGPYHTPAERPVFGAFADSAPDRWGRALMARAERRAAETEGRKARTLSETDVLLMVDDESRQGAVRFAERMGGPFLERQGQRRIPPLIALGKLLAASQHFEQDLESADDLRLLLAPGSSLGGARPKASVRDQRGRLCMAKFPHKNDAFRVELWEAIALGLARRAGIEVPNHRVELIEGKAVLLLQRFDRQDNLRIPFLSAMSMLGAADSESHSYLEIADAIRRFGAQPTEDVKRLWRRIVFNILISNLDDHLRNHGFLHLGNTGWTLSPAYDLNPVPIDMRSRMLSTAVDLEDATASLDLAMSVCDYFALSVKEARAVAAQVARATGHWRAEARQLGLSDAETARMQSAFEHEDFDKARKHSAITAT